MFCMNLVILVILMCVGSTLSEMLEGHSFVPPFTEVDSSGARMVNKYWRHSGHAVVNQNFIRLTPDRQSKKGAVWSRKNLGVDSFTSTLKFRISGQGKNFFGDGIGLWVTNSAYYTEGDLHGNQEHFYGIGIIFDTFKNTENLAQHRDVTILVNNGEKGTDEMLEKVMGCNVNVRYHNERADFSAKDASRAQVTFTDDSLKIMIDARNTGDWMECADIPHGELGLAPGWLADAYVGITASTGQLADNHDILSFETDADTSKEHEVVSSTGQKQYFRAERGSGIEDRLSALEKTMDTIMGKLESLELHTELEMASVDDKIGNILGKLSSREDTSEKRIDDLEAIISEKVDGAVAGKLNAHEARQDQRIMKTIGSINEKVDAKVESIEGVKIMIDKAAETAGSNNGGWKIPFLVLCLFVFGAVMGAWRFYNNLQKKHFL
jgi:mannose-binding lectin 2